MASQTTSKKKDCVGPWRVSGPHKPYNTDSVYYRTDAITTVTARESRSRSEGPQKMMQTIARDRYGGQAMQWSNETWYRMRDGGMGKTRSYSVGGAPAFMAAVADGSGKHSYELSSSCVQTRDEDAESLVGGCTHFCLDIDGDAEGNMAHLEDVCSRKTRSTPLVDAAMYAHPPQDLAPFLVDQSVEYPEAAGTILWKTVMEAFLRTLKTLLRKCKLFFSFNMELRMYSACKGTKLSYHAIVHITVVDREGRHGILMVDSMPHLKAFYELFVRDSFGDRPPSGDGWMGEVPVVWLYKTTKKGPPTLECAVDTGTATKNRVWRPPFVTKLGKDRYLLPLLRSTEGTYHVCALPWDPATDMDVFAGQSHGTRLSAAYALREGMITWVPPDKDVFILQQREADTYSSSSSSSKRKRKRKQAGPATTVSSSQQGPQRKRRGCVGFDADALFADFVRVVDSSATKYNVFPGMRGIVVYCATGGRPDRPCRIKQLRLSQQGQHVSSRQASSKSRHHHASNNYYYVVTLETDAVQVRQKCHNIHCKAFRARGVVVDHLLQRGRYM